MSDQEMNVLQDVAEAEPVAQNEDNTAVQDNPADASAPDTAESPAASEAQPESVPKKGNDWAHKRIDKLTGRAYAAERERDQVKAQLAEVLSKVGAGEQPVQPTQPPQNLTEAEIDAAAERKLAAKAFNDACNTAYNNGKTEFADFDDAVKTLGSVGALGQDPQAIRFLSAVTELDAPHKVLHYLGTNPEEAERVLSMSPAKQAIELARLETKVAKPAPIAVSNTPAPIRGVVGTAKPALDIHDPNISQADFERIRNETRKSKW